MVRCGTCQGQGCHRCAQTGQVSRQQAGILSRAQQSALLALYERGGFLEAHFDRAAGTGTLSMVGGGVRTLGHYNHANLLGAVAEAQELMHCNHLTPFKVVWTAEDTSPPLPNLRLF